MTKAEQLLSDPNTQKCLAALRGESGTSIDDLLLCYAGRRREFEAEAAEAASVARAFGESPVQIDSAEVEDLRRRAALGEMAEDARCTR